MTSRDRLIGLLATLGVALCPLQVIAQDDSSLDSELEAELLGDAAPDAVAEDTAEDAFPNKLPAVPTVDGGSGLFHLTSAQTGEAMAFRLALAGQVFSGSDVIRANDEDSRFLGSLSISATPIEFLEPYLVLQARSNQNTFSTPETVLSQGDSNLGMKAVFNVSEGFHLGADLRLIFLTGAGESTFDFGATSTRFAGLATFDGTQLGASAVPIRATLNLGYFIDNSDQLLPEDEEGAKIVPDRVDRFSQGLNAFSQFQIGVGIEIPLNYVTPSIEYNLGILLGDEPPALCEDQPLACPSKAGFAGNPQTLTLGLRGMPLEGLVPQVGVDIGLTSEDVQGVPVTAPYQIIFGVTYAFDPRSREKIVIQEKIVEKEKVVTAAAKSGFFDGSIIDADTKEPVAGAIIEYTGRDVTRQTTDPKEGTFRSYDFPLESEVEIRVSAPDYKSAKLSEITQEGPNELVIKMKPRGRTGVVRGTVSIGGEPASGTVVMTGPKKYELKLRDGKFSQKVLVGWYTVTITRPGMLTAGQDVEVKAGAREAVSIKVVRRPDTSAVELVENRIVVDGAIEFDGDNIAADSQVLLDQVAAVLFEHPEFARVQVGSHMDDTGPEAKRQTSTDARATAVRDYLLNRGVGANRLEAKGFGSSQPLVPNSSTRNRQINRRTEFVIVQGGSTPE